jgi:hypothetical protein
MSEPAVIFPYATGNGLSGSLRKKLVQIAGGLVCSLTNALRCLPVVVVVKPTEHRARCDFPTKRRCLWPIWLARNVLLDPLMRAGVVKVVG